jgi:hypothetical protein
MSEIELTINPEDLFQVYVLYVPFFNLYSIKLYQHK